MEVIPKFLHALFLTVAIESFALVAVVRSVYRITASNISLGRCVAAGILASSLTLPYLWFVLPAWFPDFWTLAAIGEPSVVIIEGLFYWFALRISLPRSLLLSLIANALSFTIGILLNHYLF